MKTIPIICPGCSSKVNKNEAGYVCENEDCFHSKIKQSFKEVDGIPILISDVMCDTICDPHDIRSYIRRPSKALSLVKNILLGESKTTFINCEKFISRLKKRSQEPRVLLIGSGEKGSSTNSLWNDVNIEVHGIDIYISDTVDLVCDAHYLPLESDYYDGVWIQAVLEHVVEPQKVVKEISRVLKNEGLVYAETPFMQQVHEGPYDFTRYTVLGHRYLFRDFSLISIGGNKGPEIALAWSIKYFIWSITRSLMLARFFGLLARFALRPFGYLVSRSSMFDASSGVYFFGYKDNSVKLTHKDLLKLYEGQLN